MRRADDVCWTKDVWDKQFLGQMMRRAEDVPTTYRQVYIIPYIIKMNLFIRKDM